MDGYGAKASDRTLVSIGLKRLRLLEPCRLALIHPSTGERMTEKPPAPIRLASVRGATNTGASASASASTSASASASARAMDTASHGAIIADSVTITGDAMAGTTTSAEGSEPTKVRC